MNSTATSTGWPRPTMRRYSGVTAFACASTPLERPLALPAEPILASAADDATLPPNAAAWLVAAFRAMPARHISAYAILGGHRLGR